MKFEKNYFVFQKFSQADIVKFRSAAAHDLEIARSSVHPEVNFHFAYMALVKIGIHQIASQGYRVKSRQGHH